MRKKDQHSYVTLPSYCRTILYRLPLILTMLCCIDQQDPKEEDLEEKRPVPVRDTSVVLSHDTILILPHTDNVVLHLSAGPEGTCQRDDRVREHPRLSTRKGEDGRYKDGKDRSGG